MQSRQRGRAGRSQALAKKKELEEQQAAADAAPAAEPAVESAGGAGFIASSVVAGSTAGSAAGPAKLKINDMVAAIFQHCKFHVRNLL